MVHGHKNGQKEQRKSQKAVNEQKHQVILQTSYENNLSCPVVRFWGGRQIPCQEKTQLCEIRICGISSYQIKRSKISNLAISAFKMPDKTTVSQRNISSKHVQSLYFLRTYIIQCWDVCPHPEQVKKVLLVEDSWFFGLWAWPYAGAHQHVFLSLESCCHLSSNCWFGV